jgi:hypothetical protein
MLMRLGSYREEENLAYERFINKYRKA